MVRRSFTDELRGFTGREEALRQITRYHIYQPMFYRTNDAVHSRRVQRITRFLAPTVTHIHPDFDGIYAEALARVHDDAEIITGDVQAGNKAKMSRDERHALERRERLAVDELARRFPSTLGGFDYRELLIAVMERQDPEAQIVQFADKLDAFGEALHEITAGNLRFATPVTTEYGELPIPPEYYVEYFKRFAQKFPAVAFLTEGADAVLDIETCEDANWVTRASVGALHTRDTLVRPTDLQPYNLWKQILLRSANEDELQNLTTKVE